MGAGLVTIHRWVIDPPTIFVIWVGLFFLYPKGAKHLLNPNHIIY